MWGSSLKYVSNNSNIKDKGQLRLLKNAKKKKSGVEIIASFVRYDDESLVMRTMFLFFQMHYRGIYG